MLYGVRRVLVAALFVAAACASAQADSAPPALRGVPLTGPTGLQLLVAANPPFLLNVDTGRVKPVTGIRVSDGPVLSVMAVGRGAVVWVDRRDGEVVPSAELYAIRRGWTRAVRIGSGWEVAPARGGRAIWVKRYASLHDCRLAKLTLAGEPRATRSMPCSRHVEPAGNGALVVGRGGAVDPETGRRLPISGGVLTLSKRIVVTVGGQHGPLRTVDVRTGRRHSLGWPSRIGRRGTQGGLDGAVVAPDGTMAIGFADPAWELAGTQVADVWLLDPATRRFTHLPDLPAAVALKGTSMQWSHDGRLVLLAETGRGSVIAVWRPGDRRLAVRRVRIPARTTGSDSFVVQ